jgi:hypothetical protein
MKKTLKKIMILVCGLMLCQTTFSQMNIKIERLCTYVDDSREENNAYLNFPIVSCKDSLVMEKINTFLQLSELNLLKGKEFYFTYYKTYYVEDEKKQYYDGMLIMKDKGTFYDLSDGVEENRMIVFDFEDKDYKNKGKFSLKREGNKVSGIKTKKNNKQQFSFLGKKM